jgi:hypothetical protein
MAIFPEMQNIGVDIALSKNRATHWQHTTHCHCYVLAFNLTQIPVQLKLIPSERNYCEETVFIQVPQSQ